MYAMSVKRVDLTGQRFGRLLIIEEGPRACDKYRRVRWVCRCDCGKQTVVTAGNLSSGGTKSCGCLKIENTPVMAIRHGRSYSKEWRCWQYLRNRCTNPKCDQYPNYGGRGISFCDRWKSFDLFFEDMGEAPAPKHTLDRIDVNGNYEPGNCRWATVMEQMSNKRNNRRVDIDGVTKHLSEWARHFGIDHRAIRGRLNLGWSMEDAITTPVRGKAPNGAGRQREIVKKSKI